MSKLVNLLIILPENELVTHSYLHIENTVNFLECSAVKRTCTLWVRPT
jgi:hypothetical protein